MPQIFLDRLTRTVKNNLKTAILELSKLPKKMIMKKDCSIRFSYKVQ